MRFLLGLAASRGSQEAGLEDEQRLALLDEAIAAFRSILIRRPELVRVRLELALAFYLKEEDSSWPATISSGPWWAARPRPWRPTSNGS